MFAVESIERTIYDALSYILRIKKGFFYILQPFYVRRESIERPIYDALLYILRIKKGFLMDDTA